MNNFEVLIKAILDTSSIGKQDIDKVQKVINKLSVNIAADINKADLIASIKKVIPEIESELKKISGVDIKINDSAVTKAVNNLIKDNQRLQAEFDKTTQKSNKIKLSIDNGTYEKQLNQAISATQKWKSENAQLKSSINDLELAYKDLINPQQADQRVKNEERFQQALKKTQNLTSIQKGKYATDDEVTTLLNKYQTFYDKNTAAHKKW